MADRIDTASDIIREVLGITDDVSSINIYISGDNYTYSWKGSVWKLISIQNKY